MLRCSVWPESPYGIVPAKFSNDLPFGRGRGQVEEMENARYQRLTSGCRGFATQCPGREVDFEIKIGFVKDGGAAQKRQ